MRGRLGRVEIQIQMQNSAGPSPEKHQDNGSIFRIFGGHGEDGQSRSKTRSKQGQWHFGFGSASDI